MKFSRNNLKVYYGKASNNFVDWTTDVSSIGGNVGDTYFTPTEQAHKAKIGKLGWINCGTEHEGVYSIKFVSETDHLENVGLFTYIPLYKSVIQAYSGITADLPKDSEVKIIAMGINSKDELFCHTLKSTVKSTGTVSIVLQAISEDELTSILDNL